MAIATSAWSTTPVATATNSDDHGAQAHRSIETGDPCRATFSTPARNWVRVRRFDLARTGRGPSRVSRRHDRSLVRWRKAVARLARVLKREPTDDEVAAALNDHEAKVKRVQRSLTLVEDEPRDRARPERWLEALTDPGTRPEEVVAHADALQCLREALLRLEPRTAMVVRMRYGLDQERLPLHQVAARLGGTIEWSRQLELKGVRQLAKLLGVEPGFEAPEPRQTPATPSPGPDPVPPAGNPSEGVREPPAAFPALRLYMRDRVKDSRGDGGRDRPLPVFGAVLPEPGADRRRREVDDHRSS